MCCGILLTLAAGVLEAGGWVVITVTDIPDAVPVGQPVTLTYAVRQHGSRLLGGLTGRVEARNGPTVIRLAALPAPEPGHYTATLTLPSAGDWTVDIASGFGGQYDAARITLQALDHDRPAPVLSETERGRRLFAAKGCITCHVHENVDGRSTAAGPALTARKYETEYLTRFLAHPSGARAEGEMPDLKLDAEEIGRLVAFINAGSRLAAARAW
jgi:hypothetical protein